MKAIGTFLLLISAVALVGSVFVWRELALNDARGFFDIGTDPAVLVRPVVLSVATIFGILSRVIYEALVQWPKKSVVIGSVLGRSLRSKEFWLALLVSPVIILAFYQSMRTLDSLMLVALVGYENGFFFHSVLSAKFPNEKD